MSDETLASQDITIGADNGGNQEQSANQQAANPAQPAAQSSPLLGNEQQPAQTAQSAQSAQPEDPTEYVDFAVPEGFETIPSLMEEFKTTAKGLKLSQDQAQSLINLQVKANQTQAENWGRQRRDWRQGIETDAEFGGQNWQRTVSEAKAALDVHDPSGELRTLLVQSGFEDNPAVLKFLARAGKGYLKEANVITSRGAGAQDEKSLMDRLWPDKT